MLPDGKLHLDFIEAPGGSHAACILAGVRVANHALLLALDMCVIPEQHTHSAVRELSHSQQQVPKVAPL